MVYLNARDEQDNKVIIPDTERAPLINKAFIEMSKGQKAQQDIRKEINKEGLECSKSNFSRMLRNVVYIGKIVVPAAEDEPERIVEGQHHPIVDESVFLQGAGYFIGKGQA